MHILYWKEVFNNFCQFWYLDRKFTITVTAALFAPLCYLKQLSFLRHTGPLGIISMLYVVLLTVYQYFVAHNVNKGTIKTSADSFINVLSIIPVICFGYQVNEVIIPMYYSMKDRCMKNFYKSASLAWGTLIFMYCAVGYFGYMTFGSNVLPDIIQMFDAKDPLVIIGICALIIKMSVTYPQMSFVGRGAFIGVYSIVSKKSEKDLEKKEARRRYFISSLWFISTLFIGLFAPDIGIVIEILGVLSVANVFIFPSICLVCLTKRTDLRLTNFTKFAFVLGAIILTSFGIVVMILVVYQVYIDISTLGEQASAALCVA
ncbi:putative sodium-coupled neutral amino acid transporter 7-like protein [Leptotrombidium deliense]|uniref:Putative sodium-coupled neutral amino acid transporter 7-like protein n=1 Tax=Leptotrombidium deliense TaxID=299467 RepID=A0A443SG35_9ACAR|nr:putative sodium-coupled neutral amino acid transporter 7-like protein [Leptotrombidium deliense]